MEFDALKVSYEGQPVVAVIRPPLSKVSSGIATGIVRPTGQVWFLFSEVEINKPQNNLKSRRADASNAYRRSVRGDIFRYRIIGGTTTGDFSNYECR